MVQKVVFVDNLGDSFDLGSIEAQKVHVNIDGSSIKRDPNTGKLRVDLGGVTLLSADTGNVLSLGSDGGLLLTNEEIQDAIGQAIMGATDGLEYDDVNNAIRVALNNMMFDDTPTTSVIMKTTPGEDPKATIHVKIDSSADNLLQEDGNGLLVDKNDILAAMTNTHTLTSDDKFETKVGDATASTSIVEIQDAFGVHMGEMFA
jgi:hypothetical protein